MSGSGDFDFLRGRWSVRHRRLAQRLAGSSDWIEFDGTMECRPILSGMGNVDENWLNLPGDPYAAVTLRLFDPATARWSIRWIDGRDMQLGAPVFGGFTGGTGEFNGDDMHGAVPVKVRFRWFIGTRDAAHWEQAFSADGGLSWETNWQMDFTRVEASK